MLTVTRRGLLVLGGAGAAGAALAGCGEATEPRDDADPQALTQAQAEAETNLSGAYVIAAQVTNGAQSAALESFAEAATRRAAEFGTSTSPPEPDGGPDAPEALSACQHLANVAIAAHLEAAGLLDEVADLAVASSALAACAAELAAVNGFAGDPEAPSSFVTGGAEKPYESTDEPDSDDSGETSTTTDAATTTDTTGSGQ